MELPDENFDIKLQHLVNYS